MIKTDVSKKLAGFALFAVIGLTGIFFSQAYRFHDGKLHIVFCDVGQGDGIFIRTPNRTDILLDGGPDQKVLSCLSSHMEFWDRTIDLAILSHPHQDHFVGLIDVIKRYSVLSFGNEKLRNKSEGFASFQNILQQKKIVPRTLAAGSKITIGDGVVLTILAPSQEFLTKTSPNGYIGESGEFGSLIMLLTYKDFRAVFTSDSQADNLSSAIGNMHHSVSLLQVPHHGSKTGLSRDILEVLGAKLAIISVGKNNRYHHPHGETLKLLRDEDMRILRTDQNGEIEIISDGKTWRVYP